MAEAAEKKTIGEENPLSGFRNKFGTSRPPQEKPVRAAQKPEAAGRRKVRLGIHVPPELAEKARDCVYALSGPPHRLTLAALCEQALEREIKRLAKEAGVGEFPTRGEDLRGGARVETRAS